MHDNQIPAEPIPAEEIQEVLAELGLELSYAQASEVARLLETTGDLEEAIAALDELLEGLDDNEQDELFREAA